MVYVNPRVYQNPLQSVVLDERYIIPCEDGKRLADDYTSSGQAVYCLPNKQLETYTPKKCLAGNFQGSFFLQKQQNYWLYDITETYCTLPSMAAEVFVKQAYRRGDIKQCKALVL